MTSIKLLASLTAFLNLRSWVTVFGMEEFFVSGLIKLEMDEPESEVKKTSIVKMNGGGYNTNPFHFKIASFTAKMPQTVTHDLRLRNAVNEARSSEK